MPHGVFEEDNVPTLVNGAIPLSQLPAHAQSFHGRGGTDTMLNGLEISDTSTQQAAHTFILGPRTTTTLTWPVTTLQPKTAALAMSLDIAPSAGVANNGNNGVAWIDVCDGPVIDANPFVGSTLRLAMQITSTGWGEISTRTFSGTPRQIRMGSDWNGSGNSQVLFFPMTSATPYVRLGWDGSDTKIGTGSALGLTATKGFLTLPACAGVPTGAPIAASAGDIPCIYDTTDNKLYIYNGGWKASAVFA